MPLPRGQAETVRSSWGLATPGSAPTVDDAHVGDRRMHAKLRTGLLMGSTDVCPAISDWHVEMLNEDRETPGSGARQ